jgi:predicted transcriptional regulator of viral defense system
MSVAGNIRRRIQRMPKGKPICINHFANEGSRKTVAKVLSRLAAAGELERLMRGIYMRPKISHFAGQVRPNVNSLLRVLAQVTGETIAIHGAEAVRAFGLSTQMQIEPVFYTSGASRKVEIGQTTIQLLHVPAQKLQHSGTNVGLALAALFYIGKAGINDTAIARIRAKLDQAEFEQLTDSKIPTWMKTAFSQIN